MEHPKASTSAISKQEHPKEMEARKKKWMTDETRETMKKRQ